MEARKLALILFTSVALVACNRQNSSSRNVAEIGLKISHLIQQHHFEEAAQLGLHSVKGKPEDATIYYFVALAYAKRAGYEADSREDSLKLVDEYSRQSLSRDPDNQLIRFNIALVLEYAGDVESTSRCRYYVESKELLDQVSSKSSANALKHDVIESTSRVTQKASDANCK
ncbi:MAG TPA: hypothetical protein VMP68_06645 [Candidatus Eisenbacteria bacterium]|nr:hypothetical protein [Candidatus Eisenbacteria bacterium]